MSTLYGYLARFGEWAEIKSPVEGHFMERIAPGAFSRTIREDGRKVRVMFQHGRDPSVGEQPIAALDVLREDGRGLYYEARLLDSVPPLITEGLKSGLYGASFRFSVRDEHFDTRPSRGPHNPRQLPERTLRDVRLVEGGPVTFGAYAGATAGIRSTEGPPAPPVRSDQTERERLERVVAQLERSDRRRKKREPALQGRKPWNL